MADGFIKRKYVLISMVKEADLSGREIFIIRNKSDLSLIPQPSIIRVTESVLNQIGIPVIRTMKQKGHYILFDAKSAEKTRFYVEKKIPDAIVNTEFHSQKDYTYQPNSGIDEVIARFMSEEEVIYLIDRKAFEIEMNKHSKQYVRFSQNVKLCKKYGVSIALLDGDEVVSGKEFFKTYF